MPKTPDHRTTIRFKPDEYALVTAKAGKKPVSTFLRGLALEKAAQKRKENRPAPLKDQKALAQILALLGQHKLISTFRQAQRDIDNGVKPADDETVILLRECRDLLTSIHALLLRALGGRGS
uniref:hypothetical protein n=1 Tax=Stappia sp. TaxID=1870903 RepID=UPI003BAB2F23